MDSFKKYDRPAPRYTSYPAIPFWRGLPDEQMWLKHIAYNYCSKSGVDVYIHIPYCQNLCWYCGCFRTISKDLSKGELYTQYVLKELSLYIKNINNLKVNSLHFGGGTPTFLKPKTLDKLLQSFRNLKSDHFLGSIEIDPRTCTIEHLDVFQKHAIKRISMGIQDFDPEVQSAINRMQSFELVQNLILEIRKRNFESINFDLIYGLPRQSWQSISDTIEKVISLSPDLIAFYSYAHLPSKLKNQRLINESELPSGEDKRTLYEKGKKLLLSKGYVEVGMDHFAKQDSYLAIASLSKKLKRNFMGYTDKKTSTLIGLGVSSISNTPDSFIQNVKDVKEYFNLLDHDKLPFEKGHVMTDLDKLINDIIHELMCNKILKLNKIKMHPFFNEICAELEEFKKDVLIRQEGGVLKITEVGEPFLRNVAMIFDEHLRKASSEANRFSRTI